MLFESDVIGHSDGFDKEDVCYEMLLRICTVAMNAKLWKQTSLF